MQTEPYPQLRLPRWAVIRDARRRQRRRLRRRMIVLMVLAIAGAGWLTQRSAHGLPNLAASSVSRTASVGVGGDVTQAQTYPGRVWVLTCVRGCGLANLGQDRDQLVEVGASSRTVLRRFPLTDVSAFVVAGGAIWVSHFRTGVISRLSVSGRVTGNVHLKLPRPLAGSDNRFLPTSMSSSAGSLWVSTGRGQLAQMNERTDRLVRMVATPSEDNITAIDRHGIWVAEDLDGVGRLAPHRTHLRVRVIMQADAPLDVFGIYAGGQVVWALASTDTLNSALSGRSQTFVVLIDPSSGRVLRRVPVPVAVGTGTGAVVAAGALYLGDLAHGRIDRVSRDGQLRTFSAPRRHAWLATSSSNALWAATSVTPGHRRGQLLRIGLPLKLAPAAHRALSVVGR